MPTKTLLYKDHPEAANITKVMKLREDGVHWGEIASQLGMAQGKAMLLHMIGSVEEADVISSEQSEAKLAAAIVHARDKESQSWGQISARTLGKVPEGKVRAIYEAKAGTPAKGHRIGKGGRHPDGAPSPAKAEGAAKATKATGSKKAAKSTKATDAGDDERKLLVDMNLTELKDRLGGRAILVKMPNKTQPVRAIVKKVTALKEDKVSFLNSKDEVRTIPVKSIDKVLGLATK